MARHVNGAARLERPAVVGEKGDGQFQPVSWYEALDRIAESIESARARWGGESILPFSYGGSNEVLTEGSIDARLVHRLGASRWMGPCAPRPQAPRRRVCTDGCPASRWRTTDTPT